MLFDFLNKYGYLSALFILPHIDLNRTEIRLQSVTSDLRPPDLRIFIITYNLKLK